MSSSGVRANTTGVQQDGGYAAVMIAKASALMSVPDALASVNAAPLLCAGLTTFSALRNSPAKAGDLVAVLGIGGARPPRGPIASPHGLRSRADRPRHRQPRT